MTRKKVFLIVESVLCVLAAGLPAAAAVRMYVRGAAIQASGDLFYYIFTREKAAEVLLRILPVICAFAAFTAAGWILGIKDEKAGRPARLTGMDVRRSAAGAVPQKTTRAVRILRVVVLALAAALIVLGARNGGMDDVLAKGAAICTECVGLG